MAPINNTGAFLLGDFFHGITDIYRMYKTDLDYPLAAAVMATLRHIQLGHDRRQVWTNAIMAAMFAKGITFIITIIADSIPGMGWIADRDAGWIVACLLGYVGIDKAIKISEKYFPSMNLREKK